MIELNMIDRFEVIGCYLGILTIWCVWQMIEIWDLKKLLKETESKDNDN